MKFLKNHKKELLIVLLLIALYFAIRVPNLTKMPIFADEAIYVRWAQVMRAEPTLRFLPLSDGKTPLFMWTMIPLFKVFDDPLLAGRVLSVLAGVVTVLGGIFMGWKFFNKRVGILAGMLIVLTPYLVFFDRMALVDSMLAAFTIWSINLCLVMSRYPRLDLAMFLGYFLGSSMLTKPPGMFNLLAAPLVLLNLPWRSKDRQKNLIKLSGLLLVAFVFGLTIYNILRLGPGFSSLSSRNEDYVHSPATLLRFPPDPFVPHFKSMVEMFYSLFGIPLLMLMITSFGVVLFKKNRIAIIILLWALFPMIVQLSLLQTFTARYVLFSIPPLLVLSAFGFDYILKRFHKGNLLGVILGLILLGWPIYFIYSIHFQPLEKLPLEKKERRGYLEDWTAGYGLKEIAQFLDEKSKDGEVVVGTEGSFGTLSDGLQIYTNHNRKIIVIGGMATISAQIRNAALTNQTFYVANTSLDNSLFSANTELIKVYPKVFSASINPQGVKLYKVFPETPATNSARSRN